MELSIGTTRELLKQYGVERAKQEAVTEFATVLEQYAGFISEEAAYLAEKEGRKTVKERDVISAIRNTHASE